MARIKIDRSGTLIVMVCLDCDGVWRSCAWTDREAYECAVAHEHRTHPGTTEARDMQASWQRRARRRAATRR